MTKGIRLVYVIIIRFDLILYYLQYSRVYFDLLWVVNFKGVHLFKVWAKKYN